MINDDRGICFTDWILKREGDMITVRNWGSFPLSPLEIHAVNGWLTARGIEGIVISVRGSVFLIRPEKTEPLTNEGVTWKP